MIESRSDIRTVMRRKRRPRPRPPRHGTAAGMTIIELLLAMSATALIALAIASMLFATSSGSDNDRDLRELAVRQKLLINRVTAAIRTSRQVLAEGDDYLVLWTADTTGEGEPNLSEIRLIELDSGSDELRSYESPANPSPDTEYPLASTNFDNFGTGALPPVKGTADLPVETWGKSVTGWSITLDDADPQSASRVAFQFTLEDGQLSETAIGQASPRNISN